MWNASGLYIYSRMTYLYYIQLERQMKSDTHTAFCENCDLPWWWWMNRPTKVCYLNFPIKSKQQILRLYITMNYFLAMTVPQSICNLCNIFCSPEIHKAMLNEMPFLVFTQVSNHDKHKTSLLKTRWMHMHSSTTIIPPNIVTVSYWTFLSFQYFRH